MPRPKCKICRRAGQKLFLKGERCSGPKCGAVRRPYPPGVHGQKSRGPTSEFGKQLAEKYKLEAVYQIDERDLKHIVKVDPINLAKKKVEIADFIVNNLESRLDNVVFRLGFANSRIVARQYVSHGHIRVNNRRVDIPSFKVKPQDIISIRPSSMKKESFNNLASRLEKYAPPAWLELNKENLSGKVTAIPRKENFDAPVDLSMIVAFYSR